MNFSHLRLPRISRRLLIVAASIVGIFAAVFIWEAILEQRDRARLTPPGRIMQVDGRSAHIHCSGTGSPTIVLEAGLGESSMTWVDIQPRLADKTRVCSYDRAGYGWSEVSSAPRDAATLTKELDDLLEQAGENGPYLLVAHSIGSFPARLFASDPSNEVAGIVLIDPTDEQMVLQTGTPWPAIMLTSLQGVAARFGVVRFGGEALISQQIGTALPNSIGDKVAFLYNHRAVSTSVQELCDSLESAQQVADKAPSDIPLTIIAPTESKQPNADRISTHSELIELPGANHYVYYGNAERVTAAVEEMLERIRRE